ncbi:hypothetical protein C8R45DRAFT_572491 [Mycena sanguinolenta]|nr:hypothetical protein C8R45DRAFT_572491 [Mycena sanguinolenta]
MKARRRLATQPTRETIDDSRSEATRRIAITTSSIYIKLRAQAKMESCSYPHALAASSGDGLGFQRAEEQVYGGFEVLRSSGVLEHPSIGDYRLLLLLATWSRLDALAHGSSPFLASPLPPHTRLRRAPKSHPSPSAPSPSHWTGNSITGPHSYHRYVFSRNLLGISRKLRSELQQPATQFASNSLSCLPPSCHPGPLFGNEHLSSSYGSQLSSFSLVSLALSGFLYLASLLLSPFLELASMYIKLRICSDFPYDLLLGRLQVDSSGYLTCSFLWNTAKALPSVCLPVLVCVRSPHNASHTLSTYTGMHVPLQVVDLYAAWFLLANIPPRLSLYHAQ